MTTEIELRDWRGGPIAAERLAADLLQLDGYTEVDPQATLGGPDGRKDILVRYRDRLMVVAVFFPPTQPTFAEIKAKYGHDRAGVAPAHAEGLVFVVNQQLTIGQRQTLLGANRDTDHLYHLERIRSLLDSPLGYGLRLEYLHRPNDRRGTDRIRQRSQERRRAANAHRQSTE